MQMTDAVIKECAKTYISEYGQDLERGSPPNTNPSYGLGYKFCDDCAFFDDCMIPILKKGLLKRNDSKEKRNKIKKNIDAIFYKCLYRKIALEMIKKADSY